MPAAIISGEMRRSPCGRGGAGRAAGGTASLSREPGVGIGMLVGLVLLRETAGGARDAAFRVQLLGLHFGANRGKKGLSGPPSPTYRALLVPPLWRDFAFWGATS